MKARVLQPIFGDAASKLVNVSNKYQEAVLIKKGHWVIDAKSILGLLAISLQPGQEIIIELEGKNGQLEEDIFKLGLFEKV